MRFVSNQEIFDAAWRYFIKDEMPFQEVAEKRCFYRSKDNIPCAVGLLISDTDYHPNFEHLSLPLVIEDLDWSVEDINVISMIQGAHDMAAKAPMHKQRNHFRTYLQNIATCNKDTITLPL